MPNYWTSSGTLACGDTYFMSVTCDPSVAYTGSSSCANKWTASANISCVGGLNITGISTACQCNVPPVWAFEGNTSNCNCCTPPPSQSPTPTPTNNCQLLTPSIQSAACPCIKDGTESPNQVIIYLTWNRNTEPGSQGCIEGYQIQALDANGQSGSVDDIVDNICIFNPNASSYQYYLNSFENKSGDGTCTSADQPLTFRIRAMHFTNCQDAYFDSTSVSPSNIPSSWVSFPGTYCFESCCVTPTPTPTATVTPTITTTPSITPTQTPEPTSSSTPAATPSSTPPPSSTPQPTPEPTYYFIAQREINYIP
jgi:hypothetical protein